jgi:hypothetical protein
MNAEPTTQESLFNAIKISLPSNISLVHDITELLGISYDSAYRRIRGEKELSLDELKTLSQHYKISIDTLFNLRSNNIVFNTLFLSDQGISFNEWLKAMLDEVKKINSFKEKELIYSAKDIPIFHYFEFPEIFAFKVHFWHKALIPSQEFKAKFITLEVSDILLEMGKQIAITYSKIPTCELWNEETFNSIIRQIEFCFVSGYFAKKDDAFRLCDVLETMILHLQRQAEVGFRFPHGTEPEGIEGSFKLYCNEVLLGDNTIFVKMDGNPTTYFTYNVINLLITTNPLFCQQIEKSLRILMQESTLISSTSAKDRNRFFIQIVDKINGLRKRME